MIKKRHDDEAELTKPFLKWAGGKLRVVSLLKKHFPLNAKRFVEPFMGAGSVALNVNYPKYIVNDTNSDLTSVWELLKNSGSSFVDECEKLFRPENNQSDAFYKLRDEFNNTKDTTRKASLFVYLNRHCFNGLCRYNGSGGFNTPFGDIKTPYFPRKEFEACLPKVANFEVHNKDFTKIFDLVEEGDLVYCDPPYIPLSDSAYFSDYSVDGFSFEDQMRLAKCAGDALIRGATVVISNHWNYYSQGLYRYYGADVHSTSVKRTISSKTDERKAVKEIVAVFSKEGNHVCVS